MVTNLLGRKIGGDDGEQLLIIPFCQQVNDRSHDVAEIHDLLRLGAKVINAEHVLMR